MSPAAFIDANVPIYASGREHPNKAPCTRVLMMVAEHPLSFVTDVGSFKSLCTATLRQGDGPWGERFSKPSLR